MLTEPGGPFIDVSKINLAKYAERPVLAKVRLTRCLLCMCIVQCLLRTCSPVLSYKVLFDYLFYHESNIRSVSKVGGEFHLLVRLSRAFLLPRPCS